MASFGMYVGFIYISILVLLAAAVLTTFVLKGPLTKQTSLTTLTESKKEMEELPNDFEAEGRAIRQSSLESQQHYGLGPPVPPKKPGGLLLGFHSS